MFSLDSLTRCPVICLQCGNPICSIGQLVARFAQSLWTANRVRAISYA